MKVKVEESACIGCGACKRNCPVDAIAGEIKKPHVIDSKKCIRCGMCLQVCPDKVRAVYKTNKDD